MQSIMNTFHRAMKIRKYLKLSRNSRMLSPVLGSLDSSPKPCVSFFFLQRAAGDTHARGTETPLGLLTLTPSSEGHDLPPTCCVTWGSDTPL